MTMNIQ